MKDTKSVKAKITDQERVYFTVLLGIISNGNHFPPLIVFKGKKEGYFAETYGNIEYLKSNRVLLCFN